VSKGSYYNNPQYDIPTTDKTLIEKYPFYYNPNVWPKEDLPQLEESFKELGRLIVDVGLLVAQQCDAYITSIYPHSYKMKLYDTIKESKTCKARLLYYFPHEPSQQKFDDWCGWHYDHGSLTGLTKAIFQQENGKIVSIKDPEAGLFIKNRRQELIRATWDDDVIAYQIGETAQVHSGGLLQATPHCVRGTKEPGISRSTFAVFMQPEWNVVMAPPANVDTYKCFKGLDTQSLKEGMNFAEFSDKRLAEYY